MPAHFDESSLPPDMPEEMKESIRKQALASDASMTDTVRFFRELDPDRLIMLSRIFAYIRGTSNPAAAATGYESWCDATLQLIHGRCVICGADHADELLAGTKAHEEEESLSEKDIPWPSLVSYEDLEKKVSSDEPIESSPIDRSRTYPDGVEPWITELQSALMLEFNLDDAYITDESGAPQPYGFTCKNCGMPYPSPEDRALREPGIGGCSGCMVKSRFG